MSLAVRYIDAWNASGAARVQKPVYVDCNAVNPRTIKSIAARFDGSGARFVDASIIGGPPRKDYFPTFYASADAPNTPALDEFEALMRYGMKVSTLRGEGTAVGDASALKMSYAGITKGITGLFTAMVLAANSTSPATANALLHELNFSQPTLLRRATHSIPDMLPKAYRWIDEMDEISEFVGGPMADVHKGMANVFARVRDSIAGDEEDMKVLEKFAKDAKDILERPNDQKS
ncbi:hypothetical protein EW146_g5575 [Bondarzewia mesenterica]|uniref:Phosphogluconate dehydrogenase NAD-binding putative C-terminal domain-containing protein n=1 Tax=Bondarzewia mesenterica TaxID=1095465 RepID=A0A4S4LSX9_9AGAM|nr:hypothetical protein EW146_g5575 [Bondarzewia mesenterica]